MISHIDVFSTKGVPVRVAHVPAGEKAPSRPWEATTRDLVEFYVRLSDTTDNGLFLTRHLVDSICEPRAEELELWSTGFEDSLSLPQEAHSTVVSWVRCIRSHCPGDGVGRP